LVLAFFGADYLVPQETLVFIVLYSILWGAHGILTNALIGANYALVETGSRITILVLFYVFGLFLVPRFGTTGAAMTETFTVLVALLTLPLLLRWRMRANRAKTVMNADTQNL
jgi:O-antigen/teichoic acid export membrane protein